MPDYLQRLGKSLLTGTEFRVRISEPQDPRIAELERLRRSLARAAERMNEFETRLKQTVGANKTSIRNPMTAENGFANHVAACFKKSHQSLQ